MPVAIGTLEALLELRDEFSSKVGQAASTFESSADKIKATGASLTSVGSSLSTAITLPIVAIGGAAVAAFGSFDSAMTESMAIMGNLSDQMIGEMSSAAIDVSETVNISATRAAEGYFFLASAGFSAAASIEALPVVANFAQAGMFDMATATDLATDAQSALRLTSDDVAENIGNLTRVTDVLVGANQIANASVEQFAVSLTNKAGTAMASLGIEIESGVAVLAAWADQGVKSEQAGERFNIVTRDMQTAAINNKEAFKLLNIEVFDGEGKFRNLADIIEDMEGALLGMTDEGLRTSLMQLGFTDRAVQATTSLLGLSGKIRDYQADLEAAGGATQKVADNQMQSLWNRLGVLGNRFTNLGISLGTSFEPAINSIIDIVGDHLIPAIEGIISAFTSLPMPLQTTILALAALLAGVGPVLLVVGSLITAVGTVGAALPLLATAFVGLTGTVSAMTVAMLANPLFIGGAVAVAAAVAIGAAFSALSNSFQADIDEMTGASQELLTEWGLIEQAIQDTDQAFLNSKITEYTDKVVLLETENESLRLTFEKLTDDINLGADAIADELNISMDAANTLITDMKGRVNELKGEYQQNKFEVINLTTETDKMETALGGFKTKVVDTVPKVADLSEGFTTAKDTSKALKNSFEVQKAKLDELSTALISGKTELDKVEIAQAAVNTVLDAGVLATDAEYNSLVALAIELATSKTRFEEQKTALESATSAFTFGGEKIRIFSNDTLQGNTDMGVFIATMEGVPAKLSIIEPAFEDAGVALTNFGSEAIGMKDTVNFAVNETVTTFSNMSIAVSSSMDGMFDSFVVSFSTAFDQAREDGNTTAESMTVAFKQTGGDLAAVAASMVISFTGASEQMKQVMVSAMNVIMSFASGDFVSGIVGVVGILADVFSSFGSSSRPSIAELNEEITTLISTIESGTTITFQWGVIISDMVSIIRRDASAATGILLENFNQMLAIAITMGPEAADSISIIVREAEAAGVSMRFVQSGLESMMDAMAVAVAARNEFIVKQTADLVSGIETMLDASTSLTTQQLEFAAQSVGQAFSSMLAAGVPISEIMTEIGGLVTDIEGRGVSMGLVFEGEFAELGEIMNVLANDRMQAMITQTEGMSASVEALGNMGLLTETQFDSFGDTVDNLYNNMVAGGLSGEASLALIAPQLQQLRDMSQMYGFEIDNITQGLINQAEEQGLLTDQALSSDDIMMRGFEALIETINAMIAAMGGVPVAFEGWTTSIGEAEEEILSGSEAITAEFGNIREDAVDTGIGIGVSFATAADVSKAAWTDVANQIPGQMERMADLIADDLRDIPISFRSTVRGEDPGTPGQGFQHGTLGSGIGTFMDFGQRGTPTVLHNEEAVVTREQGDSLADMIRGATSGGGETVDVIRRLHNLLSPMVDDMHDVKTSVTRPLDEPFEPKQRALQLQA